MMAEKEKEPEWSGSEYNPEIDQAIGDGTFAMPYKGPGTKMYERFFGTDIEEDPLEYIRLGSQLTGGVAGAWAGGAVGSLTGTPLGTGAGAIIGGLAGGMAGTAAPEAAIETAEFLGIADEGTRDRVGLSDQDLATVIEGESLLDMTTGGGLMAARVGFRASVKALVGLGVLSKTGRETKKLTEFAAEHGVNMLPVQVGKRTLPRGFVAVLGKFPLVSGPIKRNIIQTEKEFKKAFSELPADIAPVATLNEVSSEVFSDAKQLAKKVSDEFSKKYTDVYRRADAAGAKITPVETANHTVALLQQIAKETPQAAGRKKATHTPAIMELKKFLDNEVAPVFRRTKSGAMTTAPQSMTNMDTILTKIDSEIAKLAEMPGSTGDAIGRLSSLKQKIQLDMLTNIHGPGANGIALDLKHIDENYSHTVADLFETTAAKKFGTVKRGGLRAFDFDTATRTSVDHLTDILLRGDSISELHEVQRLVEPATFRKMAAYSIHKNIENAFEPGGKTIDLGQVRKNLGMDQPKSKRAIHTKELLRLSGGLKYEDLEKMIDVGDMIGRVEAPEASMFIARRGTLGGLEGIVHGLIPTIGVHAAGSTAGQGTAFVATAMFLGGSHLMGRAITDPRIARPLHKVLDKEASSVVKKGAALQMGRIFSNMMIEDGEMSISEALDWRKMYERGIRMTERMVKGAAERVEDRRRPVPRTD